MKSVIKNGTKSYPGMQALVDADIVTFRCGLAGEYTMKDIYMPDDLEFPVVCLRYVKDMNAWFKQKGLTKDEVVIIERPVLEPIQVILHSVKMMMQNIAKKYPDHKPLLYLTGPDNFRNDVATVLPYKGHRWSDKKRAEVRKSGKWIEFLDATEDKKRSKRPTHEAAIKKYLVDKWGATYSKNEEADDVLGIVQTKMNRIAYNNKQDGKKVVTPVIVSVDKDLRMIQGYHQSLSDMESDPQYITKSAGFRNFYKQLLTGDGVDNIPGIKGCGPKTVDKVVTDEMTTESEMFDAVYNHYESKGLYEEDLCGHLTEVGQLLWIRRSKGQMWEFPNL